MKRVFVLCSSWIPCQLDWCGAMARIQPEERDRITIFTFQRDAKSALVGRLLLRATVAESEEVRNSDIEFGRSERGKPELVTPRCSLQLNISHHGNHVVIAMETGKEVGVDIMKMDHPRGQSTEDFFRTMRRNFTEWEWSHILAPPTHQEQLAVFYRFWCLKESFIKGEGSGLSYGLQRLEFTPDPSWPPPPPTCSTGSVLAIDGKRVSEWRFQESLIDTQHCVAVAVRCCHGDKVTPTFSEFKVHKLLKSLEPLSSEDHTHWTNFISKK